MTRVCAGAGDTIVVVTVEELLPVLVSTIPLGAVTVAVFGISVPAVDAVPDITMSQVPPVGSNGMVPVSRFPDSETFAALQVAPPAGVTATTLSPVKLDGTLSLIAALMRLTTVRGGPEFETRRKKRTWVPVSTEGIEDA